MKRAALSLLAIFLVLGLFAQTMVTGYVYEDTNLNGRKDRREKGLPQVAVSNGREVVTTDEKGQYTLPVGPDNIIFVIKPANYSVPLDAFNNSAAFYIHKPGGSPAGYKYKGVGPTGPLPSSVDFALIPSAENETFRALVLGDPQPLNMQEIGYFDRGIVSELAGIQNVSFGISLGDIVWDDLDLHLPYKQVMKKAGIPWFNVMGNHDMNFEAITDSLADESFEAAFGPANYAFNYGKAHFIVLDNILYPDPLKQRQYRGGLRPGQLNFLENNLKHVSKDKLLVIAFHIPFMYGENDDYSVAIRQKVFDLIKDFPNVLIMSAHTHIQRHNFYSADDGWQGLKPLHEYNAGTSCGDWHKGEPDANGIPVSTMNDGTPKGYAFLNISGNQYTIDYKVAGKPADYPDEYLPSEGNIIQAADYSPDGGQFLYGNERRQGGVPDWKRKLESDDFLRRGRSGIPGAGHALGSFGRASSRQTAVKPAGKHPPVEGRHAF
jgi:hypothetical protein